jgi:hypothetical protein
MSVGKWASRWARMGKRASWEGCMAVSDLRWARVMARG